MIVHRRRRAGRHDEREETQRAILGAVQRVLRDTAPHPALFVRPRARVGQPAFGGEQPGERGAERVNALRIALNGAAEALRLLNERADLRRVDQIPEPVVVEMVRVAHVNASVDVAVTPMNRRNTSWKRRCASCGGSAGLHSGLFI
jgi:hypothetical protein